uniref:Uncharacterized protein n=1 Tax=Arundo donax TaxID=35708 RepID=A0A0A9CD55_ARUDO
MKATSWYESKELRKFRQL